MSEHRTEQAPTPEQVAGVRRLTMLLPAIADYQNAQDDEGHDTCRACQDGECGGACEWALAIVRQVIEAMGCDEVAWEWWVDYFEDDGVRFPPEKIARPGSDA